MRSNQFTVRVNGVPVDVAHAAASYDYVSFSMNKPVQVEITAAEPDFWKAGVDVEPWRLGIRPERDGQTIRFTLDGPAKLSISRPWDFLNHAKMLFLFATAPPAPAPNGTHVHVYAAGVYHESLNPTSGETLYLAPGAYFFGSLNLWNVQDVKVLGQGTIVYDGPQDPDNDDGWMQKPDWHCIGSMNAHNVEIDGLTCIVRSRTWSIQMKDSTGFVFDDLRVIGGNPGNANQDGMDWLGGGDTVVRNAFLRSSDDVFAMQGNWDGYSEADMLRPGKEVANILIENSELSTSISNVVRAGWPQKIYNSHNFTLRNSDILHAGIGACGQDFGLLGIWGANGASGEHSGFTFENIFLDNWYSLVQMEQEKPALHAFMFRNIWALDQPPLVASHLIGNVSAVTFDNVKLGQHRVTGDAELPLESWDGARQAAQYPAPQGPVASFTVSPPIYGPHETIRFEAPKWPHAQYTWLFGDGATARGRKVKHQFQDALGTELDGANGAGRFRVLLHVQDSHGHEDWAAQGLVVVAQWHSAEHNLPAQLPGLAWTLFPGTWTELPDLRTQQAVFRGIAPNLTVDSHGFTHYAVSWDGYIEIPADGGYTFHLLARDGARLVIDDMEVARTGPPFAQVCGSRGNAMRYARGSIGLHAGWHRLHVEGLHSVSPGTPLLQWEGPGLERSDVPSAAFSHDASTVIAP